MALHGSAITKPVLFYCTYHFKIENPLQHYDSDTLEWFRVYINRNTHHFTFLNTKYIFNLPVPYNLLRHFLSYDGWMDGIERKKKCQIELFN